MTTALVANHSVRSTSLYALSDLVWADPNLAITFSVLTARLRPHLTWRSNMKILNLNTSDTPCPYTCAVCGHLLEVSERPMRGPYKVTSSQSGASRARPWVSVCVGGCCVSGLMWSDMPVWAPGVTQDTLMANHRPASGKLTNKKAGIWDGQSGTMCGTLYRFSIIIFMMCQNFYNSKKNIVLITRQSEYFIICYLNKSHFHYYATRIRYLHWNICCIITSLWWWIIFVMLTPMMRWWGQWQQNGGPRHFFLFLTRPAWPEWPLLTETDF